MKEKSCLPDISGCAKTNALVLVEVEGGMVQEVSLLSETVQPVMVLVRDYDNFRDEPEYYQDAQWLLT
jgi:hypothetical protein